MSSGAYPPISDYGLIGDCHGAALVSRDGSIDWCCFHRFDARPVFARVLDWSKGGHYRIAPTDDYTVSRRYVEDTNIIETTFTAGAGQALLIDCMPIARQGHPHHELVRVVRGNSGEIELALSLSLALTTGFPSRSSSWHPNPAELSTEAPTRCAFMLRSPSSRRGKGLVTPRSPCVKETS